MKKYDTPYGKKTGLLLALSMDAHCRDDKACYIIDDLLKIVEKHAPQTSDHEGLQICEVMAQARRWKEKRKESIMKTTQEYCWIEGLELDLMNKQYIIICLEDTNIDGDFPKYVQPTRKRFNSQKEAEQRMAVIAPSRLPVAVEVEGVEVNEEEYPINNQPLNKSFHLC